MKLTTSRITQILLTLTKLAFSNSDIINIWKMHVNNYSSDLNYILVSPAPFVILQSQILGNMYYYLAHNHISMLLESNGIIRQSGKSED